MSTQIDRELIFTKNKAGGSTIVKPGVPARFEADHGKLAYIKDIPANTDIEYHVNEWKAVRVLPTKRVSIILDIETVESLDRDKLETTLKAKLKELVPFDADKNIGILGMALTIKEEETNTNPETETEGASRFKKVEVE